MRSKVDIYRVFVRPNAYADLTELVGRFTRVREEIYLHSTQESCALLGRLFPTHGRNMRPVNITPSNDLFCDDFLPLVVHASQEEIRLEKAGGCEFADIVLFIHHPD